MADDSLYSRSFRVSVHDSLRLPCGEPLPLAVHYERSPPPPLKMANHEVPRVLAKEDLSLPMNGVDVHSPSALDLEDRSALGMSDDDGAIFEVDVLDIDHYELPHP